jgi:hypothetical protein
VNQGDGTGGVAQSLRKHEAIWREREQEEGRQASHRKEVMVGGE